MKKSIGIWVSSDNKIWFVSHYTGEIVRPYNVRGLIRMIADMFRY